MTVLIRKMMEKSVGKVSPKESFYNYLSATLEYFNKRTLSTVPMRDNYTYFVGHYQKVS